MIAKFVPSAPMVSGLSIAVLHCSIYVIVIGVIDFYKDLKLFYSCQLAVVFPHYILAKNIIFPLILK
jgi:hypothetical protein